MQEKSNPVFASILNSDSTMTDVRDQSVASFMGISLKTIFLLLLSVVSGYMGITLLGEAIIIAVIPALIIGFIAVMIGTFKPVLAAPMGVIYACCQGLVLVLVSLFAEAYYPGIAVTAILVTASIFASMLILYMMGVIRGGSRIRRFVISALVGWMMVYAIAFIASLMGNKVLVDLLFGVNSTFALAITVFMVVVGALMLSVHFADATRIVEGGYEKKYEWSAALGLLVGIIYLYYQVLRLLLILTARRR